MQQKAQSSEVRKSTGPRTNSVLTASHLSGTVSRSSQTANYRFICHSNRSFMFCLDWRAAEMRTAIVFAEFDPPPPLTEHRLVQ